MMIDGLSQVCLVSHLRRAARSASRTLDSALADIGLNASQFTVLAALAAATATTGAMTLGALARQLSMDRSTLHRNLRPLQKAQLIEIEGGRGRTGSKVRLTETALRLLDAAASRWQACQRDLVGRIGDGDAGRLLATLERLATAHV
jgi:DNA-binding MarR family transcriptional regulator